MCLIIDSTTAKTDTILWAVTRDPIPKAVQKSLVNDSIIPFRSKGKEKAGKFSGICNFFYPTTYLDSSVYKLIRQ